MANPYENEPGYKKTLEFTDADREIDALIEAAKELAKDAGKPT